MKAFQFWMGLELGHSSSWLSTSVGIGSRFTVAALVLWLYVVVKKALPTIKELEQGILLGLWGGVGMLLQMDGLAYTDASISAFLTQAYIFFIPLWELLWHKKLPQVHIILGITIAIVGLGLLSRINLYELRIGRGEIETLLAAVMFTGQILCLNHPRYQGNAFLGFSPVMFTVMGFLGLITGVGVANASLVDLSILFRPFPLGLLFILVTICTLGGYLLMNRWQPLVEPAKAGLVYSIEPVLTSMFALFLPAWLSWFGQIQYSNERLSWRLLVGGGLVLIANLIVQMTEGLIRIDIKRFLFKVIKFMQR